MEFIKRHKILTTIVVLIILFIVVEKIMYNHVHSIVEKVADIKIESYIRAQGLENEEILEDTGTESDRYYPWVGRRIVFKKNPNIVNVYYRSGLQFWTIKEMLYPYLILDDVLESYSGSYKGVSFHQEMNDDYHTHTSFTEYDEKNGYNKKYYEDGYREEGELDEFGRVLREIPWK